MAKISLLEAPLLAGFAGKRLWYSVVENYELEEHELAQLVEAVRTVDALEALDALVRDDGVLVSSPQGMKAHPALAEARQQRITLARLLAALRLPTGEEGEEKESARQRRVGARGVYSMRTVAS